MRAKPSSPLLPRNESPDGVGTPVSADYDLNECFD